MNVGGEHVSVTVLMGPGVDPHSYNSSPGDKRLLGSADLIFYNGLHLEGRMADMLQETARRQPAYAVTHAIEAAHDSRLRQPEEFEGQYDPHVWFNVELWAECSQFVAEKLIEHDPDHADDYRRNSAEYVARLQKLHRWCAERIVEIPENQRVLVTAHDAFGYFGDAYGLTVFGLQGISTTDQADIPSIKRIAAMLAERNIKAVFVENSVPQRNIDSLREQCRALGHEVRIGGKIYSDDMGGENTPEGTYEGVVRYNVDTIVAALK
jgi:manganese/zinc/iron transport system substrate-binding protein